MASNHRLELAVMGVAALGAAVLIGTTVLGSCKREQVNGHVQQAQEHHEASIDAEAVGRVHEQEAQEARQRADAAAQTVAGLRAEVERLRQLSTPTAGVGAATVAPMAVPDLRPLVAKQDELIAAQDEQIRHLTATANEQAQSIVAYKVALDQERKANVQLQAALAAAKGLETAALWKGRIQGFCVGAAGGYVGGRVR